MGAIFRAVKSMHGIRDAEANHRDQWMTAGMQKLFSWGFSFKACHIQNFDGV